MSDSGFRVEGLGFRLDSMSDSVLQCVACQTEVCILLHGFFSMIFCFTVCCSVLQCVAVCCSVLQCIARRTVGLRFRV